MAKSRKPRPEMKPLCSVGRCQNPRRSGSEFCSFGPSHTMDTVEVRDAATKLATGRGRYADFLVEVKRGYIPTMRPMMKGIPAADRDALFLLRDALTSDGCRIYPAAGSPDSELV